MYSVMENGVNDAGAKLEERPPIDSEISDMDGLETVEEATEAETSAVGSQKSKSSEITNVGLIGNLEGKKGGSDVSKEVNKFGKVASDSEQHSDEFSSKAEELFTMETRSDDGKIATDELAKDKDNVSMDGSVDESVSDTSRCGKVNYTEDGDTYSEKPENGFVHQESMDRPINDAETIAADADVPEESISKRTVDVEDDNQITAGGLHDSSAAVPYGNTSEKNYEEDIGSASVVLGSADQKEKLKNTLALESSESPAETQAKESTVSVHSDSTVEEVNSYNIDRQGENAVAAGDSSISDHAKESSGLDPMIVERGSKLEFVEAEKSSPCDFSAETSPSVAEGKQHEVEEKRQYSSGNRDNGVQPSMIPSSGSSTPSSTTPRDGGPTIRVSQDMPSTNSDHGTSVAVSSSSNVITPNPSGAKLPEPSLQANESTPRSTGSSNMTTASPARPAGLGRAAPLLEPASRVVQQPRGNGSTPQTQNQIIEESTHGDSEEYDETREKLQMIRVKFLRLAHRLGQTPHNVVVAQVLYRLGLAEQLRGRSGGRVAAFSFDRASAMAEQLETAGQEPLDFTCTIMVIGKSGVGKSATINSIFDEVMFNTDAFQSGTKKVQEIVGTVEGIKVRVIDTPGLVTSWLDQPQNEKILRSVKRFINKAPPDIVLYLDRLDMQSRDSSDMPLLRTITEIFGPSIWFNAIVVLTHAASAPPEGPDGTATGYDMFVTQRSHVVQQAIRQAAGDMRLMNPISLVENHSACRTNRAGQRVLPNGQICKPHLLLLSFASKILAEANLLLKLQDTVPGTPFAAQTRSPPLPFLLSSLLQSRNEVKLPSDQFDDDDDINDDLDECSDSEEESEYDGLPPFRALTKAQLEKLSSADRKAYYDELEYREKLFMKKQLKEERKQRKMMRKLQEAANNMPVEYPENTEEGTSSTASVPVPMPDLALPASFDSDSPTYRYRSLDSNNPWLVRAVMEPNGWDHDIGYDGINVERLFVVKDKVPVSFSGHVSKDKKDSSLQMEIASSLKHGKGKATSFGFDMQSVGKDLAYTLRGETRFSNRRINKATAGFSATVLGDVLTGGIKLDDKLTIGKRGQVVLSGGAIYGRGDVAIGGSLEATLRDKDHPLGRFLATLGLSVMDWHGDLAIGCNSQIQVPTGQNSNLIARLNCNNRGSGQFSVRINSSEQLQIALFALIPLVQKASTYFQQLPYGQ